VQVQHSGQDQCGGDRHIDPQGVAVRFKNRSDPVLDSDGPDPGAVPPDGLRVNAGVPIVVREDQREVQDKADPGQQLGGIEEHNNGRVRGEVPDDELNRTEGNPSQQRNH
jgi:hypothetical protein